MKNKLFTALTLAAFVGVAACNDRDDVYIDDTTTDPAVEQPTPGAADPAWDDDMAQDTLWEDTLRQDDDWDTDGDY